MRERGKKIGGRLYKINVAAHRAITHVKKKEKGKKRQKKRKKKRYVPKCYVYGTTKKINKKENTKFLPWARPEILFYNKNNFFKK